MAKEKAPQAAPGSYLSVGPRTTGGYEVVEVTLVGGKLVTKRVAGPYPLAAAAERLRAEVVLKARSAK